MSNAARRAVTVIMKAMSEWMMCVRHQTKSGLLFMSVKNWTFIMAQKTLIPSMWSNNQGHWAWILLKKQCSYTILESSLPHLHTAYVMYQSLHLILNRYQRRTERIKTISWGPVICYKNWWDFLMRSQLMQWRIKSKGGPRQWVVKVIHRRKKKTCSCVKKGEHVEEKCAKGSPSLS